MVMATELGYHAKSKGLFIGLNVADLASTLYGVHNGWHEQNAIMRSLFDHFGDAGLIAGKAIGVPLILGMIWVMENVDRFQNDSYSYSGRKHNAGGKILFVGNMATGLAVTANLIGILTGTGK